MTAREAMFNRLSTSLQAVEDQAAAAKKLILAADDEALGECDDVAAKGRELEEEANFARQLLILHEHFGIPDSQ